jgi:predicted small lipoprotein YifL
MRTIPSLIACALLVAACGYKGPLYLPKDKPKAEKRAPAQQPKQEEEEKK